MNVNNKHSTTEQKFRVLYQSGAVENVCLVFEHDDSRCSIQYFVAERLADYVVDQNGDVKLYRIHAALSFLKACNVHLVVVELENFAGSKAQSSDSEI